MDHMWEAPSRLKKSLSPIILKKLAIILRQDFLRTLYNMSAMPIISFIRIRKSNCWSYFSSGYLGCPHSDLK